VVQPNPLNLGSASALVVVFILPGKATLCKDGCTQEEAMHCKRRGVQCRWRFVPNPRAKTPRFCAKKACQRARKAPWQREKMATDPDYRANQRACQRRWLHQHPQYWRAYRQRHVDDRERHRLWHQHRDPKRRARPLATMDEIDPITFIQPGIYHLIPAVGAHLAKMDGLAQQYHGIPMTEPCLHKRT
jgi:hypothetical protein